MVGRSLLLELPHEIINNRQSITGQYLSGRKEIAIPSRRHAKGVNHLTIEGCMEIICNTSH